MFDTAIRGDARSFLAILFKGDEERQKVDAENLE